MGKWVYKQEEVMNCPLCKMGIMKPGYTMVVLNREAATVIFKHVPALVCDDCGEYFLDEITTKEVYQRAETSFLAGQEISIATFAVA